MNYRHAYHAGNFADVFKHIILVQVIRHLTLKPAAFRVVDLHAGPGLYDLEGPEAGKTGEWRHGVARLWDDEDALRTTPAWEVMEPYLSVIRAFNDDGRLARYPGSPSIARHLLRPQDRLVVNELHPDDYAELAHRFRRDEQVRVLKLDAWTAIRSLLPPKERRGVVLVDPPFEEPRELERMTDGLLEALRRFRSGIYLLWYPIKDRKPIERFHRAIIERVDMPTLACEVLLRRANNPDRLNGAGMLIINPPHTLLSALKSVSQMLKERLTTDHASEVSVLWLVQEKSPKS